MHRTGCLFATRGLKTLHRTLITSFTLPRRLDYTAHHNVLHSYDCGPHSHNVVPKMLFVKCPIHVLQCTLKIISQFVLNRPRSQDYHQNVNLVSCLNCNTKVMLYTLATLYNQLKKLSQKVMALSTVHHCALRYNNYAMQESSLHSHTLAMTIFVHFSHKVC